MNKLKIYQDELYPELTNFNAKQLRQQATFIEKKNLHLTETNNRNETPREATVEVSNLKTIEDRSQPTEEVVNVIEQNTPPLIKNNMNNDNNNELINYLRQRFTENFNTLKTLRNEYF